MQRFRATLLGLTIILCSLGSAGAADKPADKKEVPPTSPEAPLIVVNDLTYTRGEFIELLSRLYTPRNEYKFTREAIDALLRGKAHAMREYAALKDKGILEPLVGPAIERVAYAQAFYSTMNVLVSKGDLDAITEKEIDARLKEKPIKRTIRGDRELAWILIDAENRPFWRAQQIAREVIKKGEGGVEFDRLVREYSEDPITKDRGGEIGWFPYGESTHERVPTKVVVELFRLKKPGDLTPMMVVGDWIAVATMVDKKPDREEDREKIRLSVRGTLAAERGSAEFERLKQEALTSKRFTPNKKVLDAILTEGLHEKHLDKVLLSFDGRPIMWGVDLLLLIDVEAAYTGDLPLSPEFPHLSYFSEANEMYRMAVYYKDHPAGQSGEIALVHYNNRQMVIGRVFERYLIGDWMLPDDEASRRGYYEQLKSEFRDGDKTNPDGTPVYLPYEKVQRQITSWMLIEAKRRRTKKVNDYLNAHTQVKIVEDVYESIKIPEDLVPEEKLKPFPRPLK